MKHMQDVENILPIAHAIYIHVPVAPFINTV